MLEEYQHVPCPNPKCPNVLRLRISEADYGKIVEVTCPTCRAKFLTTIINQNKMKELLERLSSAVEKTISESDEIQEVVQEINEAGFLIRDFVLATELITIQKQKPPKPKNLDEKTEFDFTPWDKRMAKKLHIKLDN